MHEENKNHYEIVVIGENHVNPNHAKIEAKIIKKFKPEYILYEGFVDNPKKEIKKFIDSFISNNNDLDLGKLSDEIKHNYILLRSMQDSKAEISGCDFKVLQQEQDKYEITVEDTLKGEEQVEEKRRKFFEINRIRSMYMASKIIEYAKKGKTLAIVGKGRHLDEVVEELENNDIKSQHISLS